MWRYVIWGERCKKNRTYRKENSNWWKVKEEKKKNPVQVDESWLKELEKDVKRSLAVCRCLVHFVIWRAARVSMLEAVANKWRWEPCDMTCPSEWWLSTIMGVRCLLFLHTQHASLIGEKKTIYFIYFIDPFSRKVLKWVSPWAECEIRFLRLSTRPTQNQDQVSPVSLASNFGSRPVGLIHSPARWARYI